MAAEPLSCTVADIFFKVAVPVIGGAWAFLTYVRGRTFSRRLEPRIEGQLFHQNDRCFLSVQAAVKNVGLSKAVILQTGSWVRIVLLGARAGVVKIAVPAETRLATTPVFMKHKWVEPGEEIHDVQLLQLPHLTENDVAIRLNLRVVSQELRWPTAPDDAQNDPSAPSSDFDMRFVRNLEWNAAAIVPLQADPVPNPAAAPFNPLLHKEDNNDIRSL